MSENAIMASKIAKDYRGGRTRGTVRALDGVDLAVPAGIVYGLLGPNGAGKSTLTKILTTLSQPTTGSATIAGFDLAARPGAVRGAIGYVPQGHSADPLLTGTENLSMAARLRGLSASASAQRAEELLAQFDLTEAAGAKAGTLSGGMRRKLDVAVGLVHGPSVLFLDEPTTGLDPQARAAMWNEIRRLSTDARMTVLLTTHYLDEADELASRVGIIDQGRMVIEGTPEGLKSTLDGDSITVDLVEPDQAEVRAAASSVRGLHDIVIETHGIEGRLIARTEDAAGSVGPVISALEARGVRFGAVAAARPSLDDVYLHYAGRSYSAHGGQGNQANLIGASR